MRKEADDLILRPFRAEDVKDALRYLSDPVTMRFIELPFDEEKTEAFLRQCALGKNPPVLAVEEAGEVIGHAIFHPFDGESWEIGWVLRSDRCGYGIGAEIGQRLLTLARRKGVSFLKAEAVPENAASRALLEKLGFSLCGKADGLLLYQRKV